MKNADSLELIRAGSWVTAGTELVPLLGVLAADREAVSNRVTEWLDCERARLLGALANSNKELSTLDYGAVMVVREGDLHITSRSGEGHSARLTSGLSLAPDVVVIWRPSAEWVELIRRHNRKA